LKSPDDVSGPLNLGNPEEVTMRELTALTIELIGSRSKIVHRLLPQGDPRQRRPDISRAGTLLGWAPRTPLRQGLARTIAYFEQLLIGPDVQGISALSSQSTI
jgi:UDP-glucuronate decarboxylase